MSKKIAVFTVTGDQGSSVARYLLKDGRYTVVGITRNPESGSAKALAAEGVQLAKGDLSDPASYKSALEGVYGAFVNTDFWGYYFANGHSSEGASESEKRDAKAAIESVVQAGAKHVVYSTLDDYDELAHFKSKSIVAQWARKQGYPTTNLYTSAYMSNLIKFHQITKDEDEPGSFKLNVGTYDEGSVPVFPPDQLGAWALAAFNNPDKYIGKDISVVSEVATPKSIARALEEVTGKKFKLPGITKDSYYNEPEKYNAFEELYLSYLVFDSDRWTRTPAQSAEVVPDQWDVKAWIKQSKALNDYLVSL